MLAIASLWLLLPIFTGPSRDPTFEEQRKGQRKTLHERIQAAGGWAVLRANCQSLVVSSGEGSFSWHREWTNGQVIEYSNSVPTRQRVTNIDYGRLPRSLAALQPLDVRFDVTTNEPTVVHIELFNLHRTGRRDIPYYGVWVVCGTAPQDYIPPITEGPARTVSKIADGVFEAHQ